MASQPVPAPAPVGPAQVVGPAELWFSADTSIAPAEALHFSWRLRIFSYQSLGGSVTASLLVDGTVVWTSGLVPVATVTYSGPPPLTVQVQDTGEQQEMVTFPVGSTGAQVLYPFGTKTLQLQVVGDGPNPPGPFIESASLTVGPGAFFGVWWNWNAAPTMVTWKSAYSLGGVYSNLSQDPFGTVLATLVENGATSLQTLNLGSIGSGTNTGPVTFSPITQSWQWMDDVTFLLIAPTRKTFRYTVNLNAQDPWGNQYQATSPPVSVVVSVPSSKMTDEGAALEGAVSGAELLAAAGIAALAAAATPPPLDVPIWETAAGLFAAAGVAYATAQVFAGSAKDPPEADSSYRARVGTKKVKIPAQLSGSPTADALADLFRLLLQIAADHEALSIVEGRMLGAVNASDREALHMQVARRAELIGNMNQTALKLPAATGAAIQATQDDRWLDPKAIYETILQWKSSGVPQFVKEKAANGMRPETLSAIEAVIEQTPIEMLVTPIPQQVASLSWAMESWVATASTQVPQLR